LGRHRELLGKVHRDEMVEENETKKEDCYTVAHCTLQNEKFDSILLFTPSTNFTHSFIPLAFAEWDDSLPFSGASSIPLLRTFSCYPSPPTILTSSLTSSCHLFLSLPLNLVVPKFSQILFWEFYILPLSVHVQTNTIYLTLLSLL
jgi:hypothetical protein